LLGDTAATATVRGVDVGCGASCIYPLLGRRRYGWEWVATEIDDESITCARGNVSRNALDDAIEVRRPPRAASGEWAM